LQKEAGKKIGLIPGKDERKVGNQNPPSAPLLRDLTLRKEKRGGGRRASKEKRRLHMKGSIQKEIKRGDQSKGVGRGKSGENGCYRPKWLSGD